MCGNQRWVSSGEEYSEMRESGRGNMKGCDYVSKSLSSPLLLPYLSVTKRQAIFEICRTLLEDRGNLRRRARLYNKETKKYTWRLSLKILEFWFNFWSGRLCCLPAAAYLLISFLQLISVIDSRSDSQIFLYRFREKDKRKRDKKISFVITAFKLRNYCDDQTLNSSENKQRAVKKLVN